MAELQMIWGWQPALYLFLGGLGAGAFVVAAILYFYDRKNNEKLICFSAWAATIALGAGLLLLLTELSNPLRGMLLWQSFSNSSSWMTFGAWAVFGAVIVFGLMALLSTNRFVILIGKKWQKFSKKRALMRTILAALGIAFGLVVAVYTGVLLMSAPGIPLWNSIALPCLFAVSAIDTGIALVEIISIAIEKKNNGRRCLNKSHALLKRSVIVLVLVELVALYIFLNTALVGASDSVAISLASIESAKLLLWGDLAPYFWILVVICGLILPLVMAVLSLLMRSKYQINLTILGASGALLGGCILRFLILLAGLHADLVSGAVATMVF